MTQGSTFSIHMPEDFKKPFVDNLLNRFSFPLILEVCHPPHKIIHLILKRLDGNERRKGGEGDFPKYIFQRKSEVLTFCDI